METPPPAYIFKFTSEFFWTVFLGILVVIATVFYGVDTTDMFSWGREEWTTFGGGMVSSVGRFIAASIITSITGKDLADGFEQ